MNRLRTPTNGIRLVVLGRELFRAADTEMWFGTTSGTVESAKEARRNDREMLLVAFGSVTAPGTTH